jgi:hypothetical protein
VGAIFLEFVKLHHNFVVHELMGIMTIRFLDVFMGRKSKHHWSLIGKRLGGSLLLSTSITIKTYLHSFFGIALVVAVFAGRQLSWCFSGAKDENFLAFAGMAISFKQVL